MSALYSAGVEEVLEGPATPSDGKAAARSTFFAALIYVFLFGFCYFQVCLVRVLYDGCRRY